jgi:GT2 family glycosyltransferase
MNICAVSVVIPTYKRFEQLQAAIAQIYACDPAPAEVIVHVDGDDEETESQLAQLALLQLVVLRSRQQVGPGGGRNRAIAQAKHEIVASFDDDSYPLDRDYFAQLLQLFANFPQAAIIGATIVHRGEPIPAASPTCQWVADFVGCGCAYRKAAFLQTSGYVPLPVAYGMEEVDLSLRLHHQGWQILASGQLRVFHDTNLGHHDSTKVTAASIANLALLSYLRYPPQFWGMGLLQCLNRVRWLLLHGRYAGVLTGMLSIPALLWQHRHQRQTIAPAGLHLYQQRRQKPLLATPQS